MSEGSGPRLPAAIEELLRAERQAPGPAPEVVSRVFRRVGHTVGLPAAAGSLLTSAKTYVVAALLATGTAAVVARSRKPPTHQVSALAPAALVVPGPVALEPPVPPPPPAVVRAAAPAPAPRDDGLARENALLLQARRALIAGQAASALAPLRRHARQWPHGALEQEREILMMEALARQGNRPAAHRRAEAFLRRFPDSTLAVATRRYLAPGR
jgi:hypothetical protein